MQARLALVALVLACTHSSVRAQQAEIGTAAGISTTMLGERLDEWDQSYARLKRDIWNLQRVTSMFGPDFRGRTVSDDLREFALTPAIAKQLSEQRALVVSRLGRGETELATTTLIAIYRELRNELERLDQIGAYRIRQRQVARQRDLWQQLVARAPAYQTPDTIIQLERRLADEANRGGFDQTLKTTIPALLRAYAKERIALVAMARQLNKEPIYYDRRTPCGTPAKRTNGKNVPAVANSPEPDYPTASKRADQEGNVLVNVLVSPTGCVTSFAIAVSSGWPDLDDSALNWIETVDFLPAEREGKPIEMYVTLPVNFKLE